MMAGIQTMSLFRTGHRAFGGLRSLARDRRGGPVIEFAMAAPALFLFLFLFGIIGARLRAVDPELARFLGGDSIALRQPDRHQRLKSLLLRSNRLRGQP